MTSARPMRRGHRSLAIAVTSGKGGVGKTTTTANLALCLARAGMRVTILDADLSLANMDLVLGLIPHKTIEHFFRGECSLESVLTPGPEGIQLVAAGSGIPELTSLPDREFDRFVHGLGQLRAQCDVLLIDTAAGIGRGVSQMCQLSDHVMLVTWPEPAAIVDAYAALKVMHTRQAHQPIGLLVNGAGSEEEAKRVHKQIVTASNRFLDTHVCFEGYVTKDEAVVDAMRRQRAVVQTHPFSSATRCYERLALHVISMMGARPQQQEARQWQPTKTALEVNH